MKSVFVIILLILNYSIGQTQCNLSFDNIAINTFKDNCDDHFVIGHISNSITLSTSCGDLRFTPPLVDQTIITGTEVTNSYEITTNISPNPFVQYIDIVIESAPMEYIIQVYDILGQLVNESISINANDSNRITLEHLNAGAYFVLIKSNKKTYITKKLIKI